MNEQEYWDRDFFGSYEQDCESCEENWKRLDQSANWLQEIVQQLYSREPLDYVKLEDALDELCGLLRVQIGEGRLEIARKFDGALDFNVSYVTPEDFRNVG